MIELVDDLENGDPCQKSVEMLKKLSLQNLSQPKQQEVKEKAIFLFATKAEVIKHNHLQLFSICSKDNPLACLKCKDISSRGRFRKSHFDLNCIPMKTELAIGIKVAIAGRNIDPKWGIFNGAIGIVKEIVFDEHCNPNCGDLPIYVSVELHSYRPPNSVTPFDPSNPKVRCQLIT